MSFSPQNRNITHFRSLGFDLTFVCALPVIAACCATYTYLVPEQFELILGLNLFLFGYHHVIATYTRFAHSTVRDRQTKFLIIYLPIIVLAAVSTIVLVGESWLIATIYLYWQWWHYTRQSDGISKAVQKRTSNVDTKRTDFEKTLFYLVPALAFLTALSAKPSSFLFMPIWTAPIDGDYSTPLKLVTYSVATLWAAYKIVKNIKTQESAMSILYDTSHYFIYIFAYTAFEDINTGWLAINIWHNTQYILFVWHFNSNKSSPSNDKKVINWMSKPYPSRIAIYFGICLVATYFFYSLVDYIIALLTPFTLLPLGIIAYQSINFHHYVVDTIIWKLRKPEIHKTLHLTKSG